MKAESGLGEDTTIKLHSLFDAVGAYIYAKDRSGRYLYVNKAVCDLYQRPLEDILGHDDSTFMDISLSAGLVRNDRHVIEYGAEVHEEEQMLLLHESRPRSFWTIKVPIRDASNNIIGLSGISSELDNIYANTSDAIRHNRLLNTILSNVDAYIYVKGADGTYLYANQQVSSLYGQNNDDVIGLNDIDIHGPEVAERLMKLDRRVLDSQQRQASEEVLLDQWRYQALLVGQDANQSAGTPQCIDRLFIGHHGIADVAPGYRPGQNHRSADRTVQSRCT